MDLVTAHKFLIVMVIFGITAMAFFLVIIAKIIIREIKSRKIK